MKCLKTGWKCVCRDFHRIHLVDRCLIVFMAILLIQSAYSLVIRSGGIGQSNEIDVIVRTSAASIFGYFLSANFIRRDPERPEFNGESLDQEGPESNGPESNGPDTVSGRLQILIATVIGVFCLVTLILMRDLGGGSDAGWSATAAATITQFRDFVSGCVGFLIGCPTSGKQ